MVAASGSSHIGSCLSVADILAVLYHDWLRIRPDDRTDPDRDRLIFSKGHATAILYAVLCEKGFLTEADLDGYARSGSALLAHASHHVPGVEFSTGSLGHGLPVAVGMALAARGRGGPERVYAVLSDGELDEGSNWEAILFAGAHRLAPLTAIVDYNKIQSFGSVAEVLDLAPLADKWRAFGWHVQEVDGHDHGALRTALAAAAESPDPSVLIAHTVKGKGVSFMEGRLEWHYRSPSPAQLAQAEAEVREAP
jgi:transketolase